MGLWSVCLSVCVSVYLSVTLEYCGQTVGWIKMKLGTEIGLGPGHIVLDGDRAPPFRRGTYSNFRPVCGDQTAAWIKIPLGRKVGLGPGDIVLDGDPLPQRGTAPNFRPIFVLAKRLDGS